jgi:hypothetical protein
MTAIPLEYTSAGKAYAGVLVSNAPDAPGDCARHPGILVLHGGAGPGEHERERATPGARGRAARLYRARPRPREAPGLRL